MSNLIPKIRQYDDGSLMWKYSEEAQALANARQGKALDAALPEDRVRSMAKSQVLKLGGDTNDKKHVLGQYLIQFGIFQNKSFMWVLENALSWAAFIVASMKFCKEVRNKSSIRLSKCALKEYMELFPLGCRAIDETFNEKYGPKIAVSQPCIPCSSSSAGSSSASKEITVKEKMPYAATQAVEKTTTSVSDVSPPASSLPIFLGWKESLCNEDIPWISKKFFSLKDGKVRFRSEVVDQLWFEPPSPPTCPTQMPSMDVYFARSVCVWMPRKLFQLKLVCPKGCGKELTSGGMYSKTRLVLHLDSYYNLAAEYLECNTCHKKWISWSDAILEQLDVAHRTLFPALLTYQYSCDWQVVRLMRNRSFCNSPTFLQKQISEWHYERWMQRSSLYLSHVASLRKAFSASLVPAGTPPELTKVPSTFWLVTVHLKDVFQRIDELKASITSVHGEILKINSTKKVTKKLSSRAFHMASWMTNVGNEIGQVVTSVLTSAEGQSLRPMAKGLVDRFRNAGVAPPTVLYTDRDCCGMKSVGQHLFPEWSQMSVHLDIWHFIRRITLCCTTKAHMLYEVFMRKISGCIFEWDRSDLDHLIGAKRLEMVDQGISNVTDDAIFKSLTIKEMAKHCRRRTRGADTTKQLLFNLLKFYTGPGGKDTTGLTLLDNTRTWAVWNEQQKHVACIQDPDGVSLYTQTGTVKKGSMTLPVYRCARGTTTLESFHLYLNKFIPGNNANAENFQAYLLEGMARWNEDRAVQARTSGSGRCARVNKLLHSTNQLSKSVLGRELCPCNTTFNANTNELLGMEYLLSQTGQSTLSSKLSQYEGEQALDENQPDIVLEEVGAKEFSDMFDDPTIAVPQSGIEESTLELPSTTDSDNISGFDAVGTLANKLVELKNKSCLDDLAAAEIVRVWHNLDAYDKRPAHFIMRTTNRKFARRFKQSKNANAYPELKSDKRTLCGTDSPTHWPDKNRYVEQVFVELCKIFPGPARIDGKNTSRWQLIIDAYSRIRDCVIGNHLIINQCGIQLFEVNSTSLRQWYDSRKKEQETAVLQQESSTMTQHEMTAASDLPQLRQQQASGQENVPSEITLGQAKGIRQRKTAAVEQPMCFAISREVLNRQMAGVPVQPLVVIATPPTQQQQKPSTSAAAQGTSCRRAEPVPILPRTTSANVKATSQQSDLSTPTICETFLTPKTRTAPIKPTMKPTVALDCPLSAFQTGSVSVSDRMLYARKRRAEQRLSGMPIKRYKERTAPMICGKCKKEKTREKHKQYYGQWWCEETANEPFQDWISRKTEERKLRLAAAKDKQLQPGASG